MQSTDILADSSKSGIRNGSLTFDNFVSYRPLEITGDLR